MEGMGWQKGQGTETREGVVFQLRRERDGLEVGYPCGAWDRLIENNGGGPCLITFRQELGREGRKKTGGRLLVWEADGASNQLWSWEDKQGMGGNGQSRKLSAWAGCSCAVTSPALEETRGSRCCVLALAFQTAPMISQCYPFFLGSLFFKERVLVTLQRVVTLFSLPSKPVGVVSLSILQMKKLRLMGVNWLELRSQLHQAQCKHLAT